MFEDFTRDQLNCMLTALADHAIRSDDSAAEWASDDMRETRENVLASTNGPNFPGGLDMVESLRREARTSARLRASVALELHRRGHVSGDLAHPDRETCRVCEKK